MVKMKRWTMQGICAAYLPKFIYADIVVLSSFIDKLTEIIDG